MLQGNFAFGILFDDFARPRLQDGIVEIPRDDLARIGAFDGQLHQRFAFLVAGTVQLGHLVLFSYAFFFKVLTGLTITIGAIAKLFVFMKVTARVDWKARFAPKSLSLS